MSEFQITSAVTVPPATPTTTIANEAEYDLHVWRQASTRPGIIGYVAPQGFQTRQFLLPEHIKCQGKDSVDLPGSWTAILADDHMVYFIVESFHTVRAMAAGVYHTDNYGPGSHCWSLPQILTVFQDSPIQPIVFRQQPEFGSARKLIEYIMEDEARRLPLVDYILNPTKERQTYYLFLKIHRERRAGVIYYVRPDGAMPSLTYPVPGHIVYLECFDELNIRIVIGLNMNGKLKKSTLIIRAEPAHRLCDHGVFLRSELKFPPEMARMFQ